MDYFTNGIDLSGVSGAQGVAPGEYPVTARSAEVKPTKDNTGLYLKVEFVLDNGQKLWHNFNIRNKSEVAQQIGLGQLKAFLKVSGYQTPDNLANISDIINLQCSVKVKTESNDYGEQSRITLFKPIASAAPAAAPATGSPF